MFEAFKSIWIMFLSCDSCAQQYPHYIFSIHGCSIPLADMVDFHCSPLVNELTTFPHPKLKHSILQQYFIENTLNNLGKDSRDHCYLSCDKYILFLHTCNHILLNISLPLGSAISKISTCPLFWPIFIRRFQRSLGGQKLNVECFQHRN